jgi:peptidyl-tRNA hydrolase
MDSADYVLHRFSSAEEDELLPLLESSAQAVLTFIENGLEAAMNRYNGSISED